MNLQPLLRTREEELAVVYLIHQLVIRARAYQLQQEQSNGDNAIDVHCCFLYRANNIPCFVVVTYLTRILYTYMLVQCSLRTHRCRECILCSLRIAFLCVPRVCVCVCVTHAVHILLRTACTVHRVRLRLFITPIIYNGPHPVVSYRVLYANVIRILYTCIIYVCNRYSHT